MTFTTPITIAVASKLRHAPMFKQLRLDYPDLHFNSRWIVTAELGSEANRPVRQWMSEAEMEIANAHALLVYAEAGEILKTGLVQVGIAMARRVPIFTVGEHTSYSDWQFCEGVVYRHPTMARALQGIKTHFRGEVKKMGRGNFNIKKGE